MQWSKLIFNATVNAVAALTGLPHEPRFAAARASRATSATSCSRLIDEGKAVAAAAGVELARGSLGDERPRDASAAHAHYPSMLEDVEAHRPTEIELITGALIREAGAPRRRRCRSTPPSTGSSRRRRPRGE